VNIYLIENKKTHLNADATQRGFAALSDIVFFARSSVNKTSVKVLLQQLDLPLNINMPSCARE